MLGELVRDLIAALPVDRVKRRLAGYRVVQDGGFLL
jgi:hypothetical protein